MNFVMDVFRSMGGTVLPPKRPRHIPRYTPLTIARDDFYCDFENTCLSQNWDSSRRAHPKGPNRYKDTEWAKMIQSQVYPHHSDIDWEEYVEWVENGGGDEWFQESDDETEEEPPNYRLEGPSPLYCEGCLDPRDFDHTIGWRSMPAEEFNRVLAALGTCDICRNELAAERTKLSTI